MTGIASRQRPAVALAALLLLVACAKKNVEKPAELTEFQSTVKISRVWSASVGGAPKLRLGLSAATDGKAVYAAGPDGDVVAFDAASGKRLWQTKTKLKLTGGPGVGDGLVVAGGSHGDIVALDAATGTQKWRTHINSEVLAAPAIGKGVVVVRVADGRVAALRATDGSEIWSAQQQVPKLSLRGTAKPTIVGDLAVCGFDTGRVMALALADGRTVWDASFSPPTGKSEVERLIDMDSAVKVIDSDVYAVTFHGKAARIDRDTGQVVWSRDISSYSGLATDEDGLYVSGADGELLKVVRRTGVELWKQEVLANRRLSPPVVLGSLLAVADLQGYVHFFDVAKGELAGRIHALGGRVTAAPLVVGDLLIMMDENGRLVALRATPAAAKN
ncbi:MAG: outer membrane protein assembly factor BamB [Steroidobacteraceae bacterium]